MLTIDNAAALAGRASVEETRPMRKVVLTRATVLAGKPRKAGTALDLPAGFAAELINACKATDAPPKPVAAEQPPIKPTTPPPAAKV